MKYMLLVCWDAARMDAQEEPEPGTTAEEESFPWLDELQAPGAWVTGDQLAPPRRALCPRPRRQDARDRRAVRRDEGGDRRLRPDRGRQPRRGVEIAARRPIAELFPLRHDQAA
jgi:hypothetical protein